VFINQGKGSKDRYVLFGKSFATALRTHIAAHPQNRWLFQTRRCGRFSTRRVEQIVKQYAERAGIQATPHVFRHQCITFLTKASGLADAELQLITGHARWETLAVYQHVAVDGALAERYQQAMKDVGL
jgi:site-specific recombinase XerD